MNCPDAEKAMVLSFYGDLDDEDARALRAHCQQCPGCSRKAAVMDDDLERIRGLAGARPEFDWDRSWRAIQGRIAGLGDARARRPVGARRLFPAAAGLGLFLLGLAVGRNVLKAPSPGSPARTPDGVVLSVLLRQHLQDAEIALRDVAHGETAEADRPILEFGKEKARFLRFRNRTLRTMVRAGDDPELAPLLNDLEIILYEASTLDVGAAEAVRRIRDLIREKEIFFRIRHLKPSRGPDPGQKEAL